MKQDLSTIAGLFRMHGLFVAAEPYGTGHINDTSKATFDQSGTPVHYIFQRINHNVFKDPAAVMKNFSRVCAHLGARARARGDARGAIDLIAAKTGESFAVDGNGNFWRAYCFIENARTFDVIESAAQARLAAQAFGRFQCELVDLPGERLIDTIPDFHNTPKRIEALERAASADKAGRLKEVKKEFDFIMARKEECGILLDLNAKGEIPERITHNDTKLNNVLLDSSTGEPVCVIDLDTVMPGLVHYDFGDMVRTSTSPAMEDEKDLSKVFMQFEMFEALLRGYLDSAKGFLTPAEKHYLPFSGKLITLEIGTRFLTDYLEGDVYFKIHRPEHNLDRCRTQLKLVESIESQYDKMMKLLESL
ncbi:MAG: aminoglycoside phosphotransferase family protein [Lentisphaeria bacterium]|nr:aminoglycoside phosphotransferase family protein [Lentisphaeria bacterium]